MVCSRRIWEGGAGDSEEKFVILRLSILVVSSVYVTGEIFVSMICGPNDEAHKY